MSQYLIEYSSIKDISLKEIKIIIEGTDGLALRDLKMKDLSQFENKKIFPGLGIYIFRNTDSILYVGKTTSRSFIDRVPSHFDLRDASKMNTFLRKVHNSNLIEKVEVQSPEIRNDVFYPAFDYVFNNCSLILISFDELDEDWSVRKNRINKFESILRNLLQPVTNTKNMKGIEEKSKLRDV
jgi:hypothetical protein